MAVQKINRSRLIGFVRALCAEEYYDPLEGKWGFGNGGDCCRCTDSARRIANRFGGKVVGYYCRQNPTAQIGMKLCGEGHDFASVADRYIVDYWAYRIACVTRSPVLDLSRRRDREIALKLYGDPSKWQEVVLPLYEKEP